MTEALTREAYVAIMAGGIGSRFWPLSRQDEPKQFLDVLGVGETLIQTTYGRLSKIFPRKHIFLVTNEKYIPTLRKQLPDLSRTNILAEPMRKNTAPSIAYFTHKIRKIAPEATMVIAPSDHLVLKEDAFSTAVRQAVEFASGNDALLTLGILPTRPDTGYGYIQYLEDKAIGGVYKVKTFTEKPTKKIAQEFIKSGEFLWNSGIFIWNMTSITAAFERHLPEVHDAFAESNRYINSRKERSFVNHAFSVCSNISIDYGILEKADNVYVIPASFGWSDLGTWASLYEHHEKDYLGNAVAGKNVFVYDASGCVVMSPEEKLTVLQGLRDFIVVDTEDVLLICHMSKEQDIRQILTDIKRVKGETYS